VGIGPGSPIGSLDSELASIAGSASGGTTPRLGQMVVVFAGGLRRTSENTMYCAGKVDLKA